jgi:hypothetical protein
MSAYQYYEFLVVDRPLDDRQQADVRSLSSRASIAATSFVNEYHWGDFRGGPSRMMERYYDAHLYLTNWGTHRIMLRLPRDLLDIDVAEDHCVGDQVAVWATGRPDPCSRRSVRRDRRPSRVSRIFLSPYRPHSCGCVQVMRACTWSVTNLQEPTVMHERRGRVRVMAVRCVANMAGWQRAEHSL